MKSVNRRKQEQFKNRTTVFVVCILLAIAVFLVFGQTFRHAFVNFDDNLYVYENPVVVQGLNLKGIEWAFTHGVGNNWHPLTVMSHMLDCQLYGLNAGGHHLTNLFLHTVAVILLFLVLRKMTGALWPSAFVAAVFAVHPLRVESVAWVAERKDVLSGVFFMLTLSTYVWYVHKPRRSFRYLALTMFFVLGLMSKPMLVTLPLVLLLLDYWPLNRFAKPATVHAEATPLNRLKGLSTPVLLIIEKIPLFVLSIVSCVVTVLAQGDAIQPTERVSLLLRLSNALMSYAAYIGQMIWPVRLAVFYPLPAHTLPLWEIGLALLLMVAISAGVFLARRKRPYLLVGWLWYLGMSVPIIGLVQVGLQAHADRYTYLPQIGLYLLVTWAARDLSLAWRFRRQLLGWAAFLVIAVLLACAWTQTSYWRDAQTLWTRVLTVTSENYIAQNNLGNVFLRSGRVDDAIALFQEAIKTYPGFARSYYNLGTALLQKGRGDEAIGLFLKAIELNPNYAVAHNNLGNVLLKKGRTDEAIVHFQQALRIYPDKADAHNNLGVVYLQKERVDEAIACFQCAIRLDSKFADAHYNLGNAFLQKGQMDEAIIHYRRALQINPDKADVHNGFGMALFRRGRMDEAIAHFQRVLEIQRDNVYAWNGLGQVAWALATSPADSVRNGPKAITLAQQLDMFSGGRNPMIRRTLAAAYAETGRFDEAIEMVKQARLLAATQNNPALDVALQKEVELYQSGRPLRETSK